MLSFLAFHASVPASLSWKCRRDTLGQLLGTLAARIPSLGELIAADRLHSAFVANLNGDRFVSDPGTPLGENDCVLILSADAGG